MMRIYWMRLDAISDHVLAGLRRLSRVFALPEIGYAFKDDAVRHLTGIGLAAVAVITEGRVGASIEFLREPGGKPFFLTDTGRFDFNISHSGEYVVCLAGAGSAGVDIERIRPMDGEVAARFFTPGERRYLEERPEAEKDGAFFTLWTMKESYLKALGHGLAGELADAEMIDAAGLPKREVRGWRIDRFDALAGYKLASCSCPSAGEGELIPVGPGIMDGAARLAADIAGARK
jgi:4'-phosphopantetheinyl transferase